MGEYTDKINDMVWSYSRITAFAQCKYQFYLKYIVADDDEYYPEGNYYAEVGSFVHEILAMIFRKELSVDDAARYFVDHFDENVFYHTKQSIEDKTFEACANYFCNVGFDWLDHFDVLGVEKEINDDIGGYKFTGFIDLLVRHKETGDIILIDHKSAKYPLSKKTGNVLEAQEASFESYKKQMYLYCHAIKQEYGEFPKRIVWNHFKEQDIVDIPFNYEEYVATLKWFVETIANIEHEDNFSETYDYFYCKNLCDFRSSCEYAKYREEGE